MPQPTINSLLKPICDFAQCRRVYVFDEFAGFVVLKKSGFYQIEMMTTHSASRCRKCEHVVDGRRDLERALVTVAFDAIDPFWVHDAAAYYATDLVLERADDRPFGA